MTDTAVAPAVPTKPSPAVRILKEGLSRYSLVLVWILMAFVFSLMLPGVFGTGDVAKAIFGSQTPLVFLGLALVITLSVGEFDLSFAAIFGWSATLVPALVVLYGWSMPMAVLAAIVSGLVWGAINGILVVLVGHQLGHRDAGRLERRGRRGVLRLPVDDGQRDRPGALVDRAGGLPRAAVHLLVRRHHRGHRGLRHECDARWGAPWSSWARTARSRDWPAST